MVPGGSWRKRVCEIAVTCATAFANLHAGMKKYLYDADAIQGLRFDVFDVVDGRGEYPFVIER